MHRMLERSLSRFFVLFFTLWITSAEASHPLISKSSPYDPDWVKVYDLLNSKCRSCHRPNQNERQDLSTYQALLSNGGGEGRIVSPGLPEESLLWEYVSWNAAAERDSELPDSPMMPLEEHEWLSAAQQAAVYRWIQNGAREFVSPRSCKPLTELEFPSAKICAGCHVKQYDEWSRSMHAYAQHSPVFEAFNLTLLERTSGTIGTFCTRCHTPIGTALGENGVIRNVHRTRISMEGVTCVVCHRRGTRHYKNNGRLPVEPGGVESACMYGPFDSSLGTEVGSHHSARQPYLKSSQFCGECHDVVTPTGVRNEEAFSEWQRSPAAKKGITCQSCHMGPVQGLPCPDGERPLGRAAVVPGVAQDELPLRRLSDHTFAGPDYSMLPDTEFPHKLDWMYEVDYRDPNKLTPYQLATLRELRRRNRESLEKAREKRFELLSHAARLHVQHPPRAAAGTRVKVRVDVQSVLSGHHFPTGFMAERQVWIDIEVRDPEGRPVFRSGKLDGNGDLRNEHSHEVLTRKILPDRYLFNLQSEFAGLTNKGTERTLTLPVNRHVMPINIIRPSTEGALSLGRPTTFRIAKRSLPPLKSLGQTYPVKVAKTCGTYSVEVKLRFRNLPPALLDYVGVPHLKRQLEIVELAHYRGTIHVADERSPIRMLGKGFR